jgi:glycosyltransferase involved in cell wall biosynthesis
MTNPLVTVGVPVYAGQDMLPALLECLRAQTYRNIEILISVDGADQASAEACKPFLQQDSRFRMYVQPSRLGWAGNTDWTMRQRRGDFYVYQQHDALAHLHCRPCRSLCPEAQCRDLFLKDAI